MNICVSCGTPRVRDFERECCLEMKLMTLNAMWQEWLILERRNKTLEQKENRVKKPVDAYCPGCGATFEVKI